MQVRTQQLRLQQFDPPGRSSRLELEKGAAVKRLEMFVRRADGTAYVEHVERDTAEGRRVVDRLAWSALSRKNVVSVEVTSSDRIGGYSR